MKFEKVLIASDYDGTLYNEEGIITTEVRDKIAYFIANGGKFTVSTGRTYQGFHAYDSSYINAPVMLANGAVAYDYEKDCIAFANSVGEDIFDALRDVHSKFPTASIEMYSFFDSYVINNCPTSTRHFTSQGINFSEVSDPSEAKAPWAKVMIFSPDQSQDIQEYLSAEHPELHFLPTSDRYIEVMNAGVDKGTGLLRLADTLSIPHNRVYAVGDGYNDIEMLVAAECGFVPCNGSEEALAVAGQVVRSNDEGAVAHVIEILDEVYL
ncbi:MAG: Cof-type HAD-IIB family hydrolase [Clostridia bacterium]|nr:Cof-type HAD-IIB family hydrolase [Clostridia bacterium]